MVDDDDDDDDDDAVVCLLSLFTSAHISSSWLWWMDSLLADSDDHID